MLYFLGVIQRGYRTQELLCCFDVSAVQVKLLLRISAQTPKFSGSTR